MQTLALDDSDIFLAPESPPKDGALVLRVDSVGHRKGHPHTGSVFPLKLGQNTIGKGADQTVRIDYEYLSSKHAILTLQDDLLSAELRECVNVRNGTFVEVYGQWIKVGSDAAKSVYPGMKIKLADVTCVIEKPAVSESPVRPSTPTLMVEGTGPTVRAEVENDSSVFRKPADPVPRSNPAEPGVPVMEKSSHSSVFDLPTQAGDYGEDDDVVVVVVAAAAAGVEAPPRLDGDVMDQPTLANDDDDDNHEAEPGFVSPTVPLSAAHNKGGGDNMNNEPTLANDGDDLPDHSLFVSPLPTPRKELVVDGNHAVQQTLAMPPAGVIPEEEKLTQEPVVNDVAGANEPTLAFGGDPPAAEDDVFAPTLHVKDEFEELDARIISTPVSAAKDDVAPAFHRTATYNNESPIIVAAPMKVGLDDDDDIFGPITTASQRIAGSDGADADEDDDPLVPVPGRQGTDTDKLLPLSDDDEKFLGDGLDIMSADQLRQEAEKLRIPTGGNKSALLSRIRKHKSKLLEEPTDRDSQAAAARPADFGQMTLAEIKAELRNLGLSVQGNKARLLARLQSGGKTDAKAVVPTKKTDSNDDGDDDDDDDDDDELIIEEEQPEVKAVKLKPIAVKTVSKTVVPARASAPAPELKKKGRELDDEQEAKPESKKKTKTVAKVPAAKASKKEDVAATPKTPVTESVAKNVGSTEKSAAETGEKSAKKTKKVARAPMPKSAEKSLKVFWYWAGDSGGKRQCLWQEYDAESIDKLEQGHVAQKSKVTLADKRWVDLTGMVQRVTGDPKKRRAVLRSERKLVGQELEREDGHHGAEAGGDDREPDGNDAEDSSAVKKKRGRPNKSTSSSVPVVAASPQASAVEKPKLQSVVDSSEAADSAKPTKKAKRGDDEEPQSLSVRKGSETAGKAGGVKRRRESEVKEDLHDEAVESSLEKFVVGSTGITDQALLDKFGKMASLGAQVVDDVTECTCLVTDGKVRRTVKMLVAMNQGCHIVGFDWVTASLRSKKLLDPRSFYVEDKETEAKFGFSLRASLDQARREKVFAGLSFHCTENTSPDPAKLRDIIESGGGKVLPSLPIKGKIDDSLIVISAEQDWGACQQLQTRGFQGEIHTTEFVLSGVLKQSLERKNHLLQLKKQK